MERGINGYGNMKEHNANSEPCRSCWWKEGWRCYNEAFASIDMSKGRRDGEVINDETLSKCTDSQGYWNKRSALTTVMPNNKLVIVYEKLAGQN